MELLSHQSCKHDTSVISLHHIFWYSFENTGGLVDYVVVQHRINFSAFEPRNTQNFFVHFFLFLIFHLHPGSGWSKNLIHLSGMSIHEPKVFKSDIPHPFFVNIFLQKVKKVDKCAHKLSKLFHFSKLFKFLLWLWRKFVTKQRQADSCWTAGILLQKRLIYASAWDSDT